MTLLAAVNVSVILSVTWTIFLVVIGVNALILVHEWGHFIVARMCGVKCDKFYIWFDAWGFKFFSFKWGDTEFGFGWLPLGGYVKMLGQEDHPGRIQEEFERAKEVQSEKSAGSTVDEPSDSPSDATVADAVAKTDTSAKTDTKSDEPAEYAYSEAEVHEMEEALYSPDSYLSKSVPQRMAIIVAGVVMNVIFAFVCAVAAYTFGVDKPLCGVGEVSPGGSAWTANLQVGDTIQKINGREVTHFEELTKAVTLGASDQSIDFEYTRLGQSEPTHALITPGKLLKVMPMIGIRSPRTLELSPVMPASSGTPASVVWPETKGSATVVEIDGQPISSHGEYFRYEATHPDEPFTITLELPPVVEEGTESTSGPGQRHTVKLMPRPMRRLGLVMKMGPVTAIQNDSPAIKAGIMAGDLITEINGQPVGDPMTWPDRLRKTARELMDAGQPLQVSVTLTRGEETVVLDNVAIRVPDWYTVPFLPDSSIECAPLGIAYRIEPVVEAVLPGSPAEKAEVQPGSRVTVFTLLPPSEKTIDQWGSEDAKYSNEDLVIDLAEEKRSWPELFSQLVQSSLPGTEVRLTIEQEGEEDTREVTMVPVKVADWNNPDRGLNFMGDDVFVQAKSVGQALAMGTEETGSALMMVFRFIRKLSSGDISPRLIGGPWTIAQVTYEKAKVGMGELLLILCLLSANLAVLNILPIPVLDGGHLVFLVYEGIFKKPPNETVQVVLSYIGLFMLLSLMIWAFGLDLGFISRF